MSTFLGFPVLNGFRSKVPAGFYDPVKGHTGLDFGLPSGTALLAPVSLKIRDVRQQTEMGLTLYAEDPDGRIWVFAHLSLVETHVGATVAPYTVFAKSGNSGTATTGPHLHLEVISTKATPGLEVMTRSLGIFKGYNVDPGPLLDAWAKSSTPAAPHWAEDELAWLKSKGWITQTHTPETPVTWGELAAVLKRMVGE